MAYDYDRRPCRLLLLLFGAGLHMLLVTGVATVSRTCPSENEQKFDCMPGFNLTITEDECTKRDCCWQVVPNQNKSGPYVPEFPDDRFPIHVGVPSCYYPVGYPGYHTVNDTTTSYGMVAFLKRNVPSSYPDDVTLLRMDVYMETTTRLRVKITDAERDRYEVPIPQLPTFDNKVTDIPDYSFNFNSEKASFSISRRSSKEVIFDTSVGSFVFSDHFIQLSAALPSTNLYGLGQHNDHFRRSFDWQIIPLFASLFYPDYGSHPFYLALEKTSMSHGVFLFNSNAMDVFLQPTPAITYRTTGGILDLYFFLGPQPETVIEQYTTLIGKPAVPPYWSLGFQLSRYDYNSANNTRAVWQRNVDAGIPLDVQWNDIDYLDNYKAFTYDTEAYANLPQLIDDIHIKHMRYVSIGECGIYIPHANETYETYEEGMELDIFIKNGTGDGYATGKVWPDATVFPDFTHPWTQTFWTNQYKRMYGNLKFDGAWIDMDEPTTFTAGSAYDDGCPTDVVLPFTPAIEGGSLYARTICMSSKQHLGDHFDLHNLYGFTEAIATNQAMREILNKRPFVMSRSTFPGHGHYGTHWTGDVFSSWNDLKQSIPAILNFNMYGIPMVGSDICGFRTSTNLELCKRWTELGAFYPFARNHNDKDSIEQDPVALGKDMVDIAIKHLTIRYMMLPYMYSQFFRAHLFGGTVVRPLFFEFPEDEMTHGMDEQFLWGRDVLILPVLYENTNVIESYLPKGLWYVYPEMEAINSTGAVHKFDVKIDEIVVALRGGAVIVFQSPKQTTFESRQNAFGVIVTLDHQMQANGELYWDEGDSLDPVVNNVYTHIIFHVFEGLLVSVVDTFNYPGDVPMTMDTIIIYGVPKKPENVQVNNRDFEFVYGNQTLLIASAKIPMSEGFTVTWGSTPPTPHPPTSHPPTPPTTHKSNDGARSTPLATMILLIAAVVIRTFSS